MLTDINNIPPNSLTPLPANYGSQGVIDLFNLYAAGLTAKAASDCLPSPESFSDLAPAGTMFPVVTPGSQPALNSAVLSLAPVSPLAAQVYQTQARQRQMLVNQSSILTPAVNAAGQQGSTSSASEFADAAEVLPMGQTANMVIEKTPLSQRQRRKGPPRDTNSPGTPWGGAPVSIPQGGCQAGLSAWAKLFLLAGAGVFVYALAND
jgi:hypothetical protein